MSISKPLAKTQIRDHFVSTVELPGDLWFETMVFQVDSIGRWVEKDVARYDTRREAVVGHVVMVGRWKEILQDYPPCYECGDPGPETVTDENEFGEVTLPICTSCRYKLFGDD